MLIVVYDVNVLLIVLTTQRDGFDKVNCILFHWLSVLWIKLVTLPLRKAGLKVLGQSTLFIYPTNAQLDCSKGMLKFTLKFTLKVLLHVSV